MHAGRPSGGGGAFFRRVVGPWVPVKSVWWVGQSKLPIKGTEGTQKTGLLFVFFDPTDLLGPSMRSNGVRSETRGDAPGHIEEW